MLKSESVNCIPSFLIDCPILGIKNWKLKATRHLRSDSVILSVSKVLGQALWMELPRSQQRHVLESVSSWTLCIYAKINMLHTIVNYIPGQGIQLPSVVQITVCTLDLNGHLDAEGCKRSAIFYRLCCALA